MCHPNICSSPICFFRRCLLQSRHFPSLFLISAALPNISAISLNALDPPFPRPVTWPSTAARQIPMPSALLSCVFMSLSIAIVDRDGRYFYNASHPSPLASLCYYPRGFACYVFTSVSYGRRPRFRTCCYAFCVYNIYLRNVRHAYLKKRIMVIAIAFIN